MKKTFTLLLGAAMAMSASALTIQDLTGVYELQDPYGSLTYIAKAGTVTYGINDGDIETNKEYINNIKVYTDGEYLYFSNFLNISFYAEADLDAMTVTIPVQEIVSPTGYSFTQCLYDSRMFANKEAGETAPTFTDDDAQPIVLHITADGDLSLYNEAGGYYDYIAHWGWNTNYGFIRGLFHKTSDLVPDPTVQPIIGKYTCTTFAGEWCSIWGTWNDDWYTFDISTNEGIDTIGVDPGPFEVNIVSLNAFEVAVNGLWWGGLNITGTYNPETKTMEFPLQQVWGGYTLCNSSVCDIEVPKKADIVPATAVVNDDGSITMNYTVSYSNNPYLFAKQILEVNTNGITDCGIEELNTPAEYYNVNGVRVNPSAGGIYIVHQGGKVSKKLIK